VTEVGVTIEVFVNDVYVGSTMADVFGVWSLTQPTELTEGTRTVRARATDAAGNTSPSSNSTTTTFTVDITPPSSPFVTAPAEGLLTNDSTPTYSGTAEPNSTITVLVDATVVGTTTADASGNWEFSPNVVLRDGSRTMKARARDVAGNTSTDSVPNTFTVDTVSLPAPQITAPVNGALLNTRRPRFAGTAEPQIPLVIEIDGQEVFRRSSDSNGAWDYRPDIDLGETTNDIHSVRVYSLDAAGNKNRSSVVNFRVDSRPPNSPTITVPEDVGAAFLISGTADSLSRVAIYVDGIYVETVAASNTGTWSFNHMARLSDGSHFAQAKAIDEAENSSEFSAARPFWVDNLAPAVPVITSPINDSVLKTATPRFRGTAESGATVTVKVDEKTCTAVASAASGTWECSLATRLLGGVYSLTATATDKARNISATSDPVSFTIAPQSPGLLSPQSGDFINDATPTLIGSADANNSIEIVVDGERTFTTESAGDGMWRIELNPPLGEGSHSITVISTDRVGNPNPSPPTSFTVDLTPPDTAFAPDSPSVGAYSPSATFSFFSEEGSSFECSLDEADFSSCNSPTTLEELPAGEHSFRVRARDRAGNVESEPATYSWTRDLAVMEGSGCSAPGGALSGVLAGLILTLLAAGRRQTSKSRTSLED
jgi:hypothetical protein